MPARLDIDIKVYRDLEEIGNETKYLVTGPVVGISGGSTYASILPYWKEASGIQAISFFPVDERMVPFEDESSNWRMAYEKLFRDAGIPEQKEHIAIGATQYEDLLVEELGPDPVFDQIFLGMGDDGHTASLFPGGDYLEDTRSLVLLTTSPKPPYRRVTLGLRPLWSARQLIAIVTGAGKREMVHRLIAGDTTLPITLALQGHPSPMLILDEAAAGDLRI